MKKLIHFFFILLIISIIVIIPGCVSSSQAAPETGEKESEVDWDGTTEIKPDGAFYYDDLSDGGSSKNLGTFEKGTLILKGSVTTKFQYGFIGAGFTMITEFKKLLIAGNGIKFKVKGDGKPYRCRLESTKVGDFDHFGYVFRSSEEENEIIIPYKHLTQEGWGKSVKFNPKDVFQISFQTVGQPHESVYLEVSNLEIIPPEK